MARLIVATPGFSLDDLADRLGGIAELDDFTFAAYGLDDGAIAALRRWAIKWETDIRERIAAGEEGPSGAPDSVWDAYLDEP